MPPIFTAASVVKVDAGARVVAPDVQAAVAELAPEPSANWTLPAGAKAQTMPRNQVLNELSAATLASGRLLLAGLYLQVGQVITDVTFCSGGTAMGTPTNQWFSLWDGNRNKLGVTNDDGATAWATNSFKTLTLTAPHTVAAPGIHYVGIVVIATTVPTLRGVDLGIGALANLAPAVCGTSNTGLTTPASAPAQADPLAATSRHPYSYLR